MDYTLASVAAASNGSAVPIPVGLMTVHREYEANKGRWALMRDVVEGLTVAYEAIKARRY